MILQALNQAYDRMSKQLLASGKPRVPPYGYSYENIGFALVIDASGKLIDVDPVDAGELDVPSDPMITRTFGIEPMFLWDKTAYVLGLTSEQKKRTGEEHEAFKKRQSDLIGNCDDNGLVALLRFLSSWRPAVDAVPRFKEEIVGKNVVFQLAGERGYIHERQAARGIWLAHLEAVAGKVGLCLVTGDSAPIALTHPTIGGVKGAQSSGAAIVSFNQESFVSLGKKQGENSPISAQAAFAYTTVLNELLRKGSRQKLSIGGTTFVYWAVADDPEEATVAESVLPWLCDKPSDERLVNAATAKLRTEVMKLIEKGLPLEKPELHLARDTNFYILGLSPNAARLSVRFWEATTLGELGMAFHQHWRDLLIETPLRRGPPPTIAALALRNAPARIDKHGNVKFSFDDVSPLLAGELFRAVVRQRRYPGGLLSNIIMRVRTDGLLDRTRASLIKAIIVRAMRLEGRLPQEDYLVRTDPDDPNVARRLGRLFAVLERTQNAALGDKVNATIKDKYLGAAAATPGRVFPGLITNAAHHTARLRKGHTDAVWVKKPAAAGFALNRDIGRLTAQFHDGFPAQQSIEEQGMFLVGYYQECFGGRPDPDVGGEVGIDIHLDDTTDHEQE